LILQAAVLGPQAFLRLNVLGVHWYTGHWTDLNALRLIKMPFAFSAFGRINFVNFQPQINRLIGALRLANIAIDAFISDH